MKTLTRTLTSIAAVALGALPLLVSASPVAAATSNITGTWVSEGDGFANVYDGHVNVVSQKIKLDNGDTVIAYCVDMDKTFNDTASFVATERTAGHIANLGAAGWIAANSSKVGTPFSDAGIEAVTVQLAIWNLTNGTSLDASHYGNRTDVQARATQLVAAAQSADAGPVAYNLALKEAVGNNKISATATLTDESGKGISGKAIRLTMGSENTSITTDKDGNASYTFASTAGGNIKATFIGTLNSGTLLVPSDGSQPVITGQSAAITRTASLDAPAVVIVNETPTPLATTTTVAPTATTVAPTTTTTTPVKTLPFTGAKENAMYVALGGLLIAALTGGGLALYRRRFSA